MIIKLLVDGGDMKPGPALSQKLGPLGMNMGEIISKINDSTKDMKGLKVPVEVDVNPTTKEFSVQVFSPPVSELLKKELGIEKGSGEQSKVQVANASIEQIISVAKTKLQNLLAKDLKAAVKSVVGTCVSLGILIESKSPVEIEQEINNGKYDKEIQEEKTETSEEKKAELKKYFEELREEQEKIIKQEKAAKEAEAEKKEETETEEKPSEESKEESKEEKK
ncbi:50S ribosomal protein L11 [Candidatus Pacearchaeota archaeon]|nr:50S ribosomal protein L11 [Candidatus Pacearchaeota archaeon]